MESNFDFHAWHLSLIGTYLWHSTLAIFMVWVILSTTRLQHQVVQEWLWKLALTVGFVTAPCHLGLGSGSVIALPLEDWCHRVGASTLDRPTQTATSHQELPFESRFREESSSSFDRERAQSDLVSRTEFREPRSVLIATQRSVSSQGIRLASIACIVWYLFVFGRVGYAKFRLWHAMHKVPSMEFSSANKCLNELMERGSMRRRICIFRSDRGVEPAVFGLWKPTILLPVDCTTNIELPSLYALMAHEVAHIARRDLFWTEFGFVVRCLFPFHLPFRIAFRKWQELAEQRSDDWAIDRGVRPIELSQTLSKIAQLKLVSANLRSNLRPSFCMGATTGCVTRRIQRLLEPKNASSKSLNWKFRFLLMISGSLATLFLFGGPRFVIANSTFTGGSKSNGTADFPTQDWPSLPANESERSRLGMEKVIGELTQLQVSLEYATRLVAKSNEDDELRHAVHRLQNRIQDLLSTVHEIEFERNR